MQNVRHRRRVIPALMIAALLALLVLLAALQYRWLGEVGEAELERMRTNLRRDVSRFGDEFDSELTRAFVAFGIRVNLNDGDAHNLPAWAASEYAQRYERWMTTAAYPRLVQDLFLVEVGPGFPARLSRFVRETRILVPTDWPADFAALRARFEELFRNRDTSIRPRFPGPVDPTAEEVPALIIPLVPARPVQEGARFNLPAVFGFSIVRLDRSYMERELIPALSRRYFAVDGSQDYHLAIVSGANPRRIIYKSDPRLSDEALGSPDAEAPIFTVRFDALQNFSRPRPAGSIDRPDRPPFRSRGSFVGRLLRRSGDGPAPPPWPGNRNDTRWQLIAKHRSGSLEAVVGAARWRNLLISFSILVLLGASMVLIILSTQRAQQLAKQHMDFVAGVSHELRTPLTVICSAAENLADGVVDDGRQVRRYGTLIRTEGRRLARMVEQILEFAGIQSGRRSYEMRSVQIDQLISGARAACEAQIKDADIRLELELQPNLPAVRGDAAALTYCIRNLLDNAMKYGGESRWVKLQARRVGGTQGPEVQIKVQDRGLGIAPADLPHLFEPFYRGQQVVAAQIHGNGLGLSLVKNIVEAHGGTVTVESSPGQGSVFTLHLPAPVQQAGSQRQEQAG